ncbi:ExbD/TolR family protein [Rhodovulum kholense]|uniref:ExbD/TolR family protein n=1 Tax=Rhodovulum kholense TaxID=453584 RepID=UPI001304F8DE|nr:biopolymer transporter ExbD [Rhodovulum kholense]
MRRPHFALTALADTMFQLLIFFMLSSGLTPYALLPLTPAAGDRLAETRAPGGDAGAETAGAVLPAGTRLWQIGPGSLIAGGQRFGFDEIGALARALAARDPVPPVVLLAGPGARVQDLTTALDRLRAAGLTEVRLGLGGEG